MAVPEDNKALQILHKAAAEKYAIPAMCCYNVEGILATVRAAEAKRSPAMLLLCPWAIHYAKGVLVHAASEAARTASVPITVHLDHAQTPEIVRKAADLEHGFDSIMVDMSHYEKHENLALTHELTEYCHKRGIVTEAEPGRIEGGEDGVADTSAAALEGLLTTPEDGVEFVNTGIDWLAPAIGNVHGNYGPRGIQLEYDRLQAIRKKVGPKIQLVLHGADPFTREIFHKCIECGVSKINLNKPLNRPCLNVWKERAGDAPISKVIEEATQAMQDTVENIMDMLESTGKA